MLVSPGPTSDLAALVEVHDEAELDRALAAGADLVGVNQRDLRTFEVDRERALRMGERMPDGVVAVAESGIRDAADVGAAGRRRVHGGPGGGDAGALGRPHVGCRRPARRPGMSSRDDGRTSRSCSSRSAGSRPRPTPSLAVGMGASAVGFVFAPSPRQMAPSAVADIVKRLPHETVTVGVFRDESPRRVVEIAGQIGLRAVQLHGLESADDTRWVAERVNWTIKAFPAGHRNIERFPEYGAQTLLDRRAQPGLGGAVRLEAGRRGRRPRAASWCRAASAPTTWPGPSPTSTRGGSTWRAASSRRPG